MCSQIDVEPALVYSADKQVVPANSQMIWFGVINLSGPCGLIVTERCDTALPGGLLLAPCLAVKLTQSQLLLKYKISLVKK